MSLIATLRNKNFVVPDGYEPMDFLRKLWVEGLDRLIVPAGYDSNDYLKKLSYEGLYRRYPSITDENRSRLDYELDVIKATDLTSWFLLTYDLFSYLREHDIDVAPGCGAQPGSLVSYCLDITDIDPFKYDLLFQRLINKSRKAFSLGPFIHMEIGGSKALSDYIVEKYGEGMPSLLEALDIRCIEHKELSIIKETVRRASDNSGKLIDITAIDYEDKAVYEYIKSEKTDDLFLLNDITNEDFVKKQRIQSFDDLVARFAIDRPGPDYFSCPRYIKNQYSTDTIEYECPELIPILESTYGCIIYQEQIMQILSCLGGLSLEQSDLVRRSMAKQFLSSIKDWKKAFVSGNEEEGIPGCVKKGFDKKMAEKIYDRLSEAAPYAFTKAHAVAFAMIIYRMTWLKYYFNHEFKEAIRKYGLSVAG